MRLPIHAALRGLLERYIDAVREVTGTLPVIDHDPAHPSPCEVGTADGDEVITWRPARRDIPPDFRPLEAVLGTALHEDLQVWFGAWWCVPFEAQCGGETVVLSLVGSNSDWARVVDATCRHVEALRERSLALTIPVAALYDGRFVSVDNTTGAVLLEAPRRDALPLAPNLAAWINALLPIPL